MTEKKAVEPPPFYSGFCGHPDKTNSSHVLCPAIIRNGASAPRPFITCACTCHQKPEAPSAPPPRKVIRRPGLTVTAEPEPPARRRVVRRPRG